MSDNTIKKKVALYKYVNYEVYMYCIIKSLYARKGVVMKHRHNQIQWVKLLHLRMLQQGDIYIYIYIWTVMYYMYGVI